VSRNLVWWQPYLTYSNVSFTICALNCRALAVIVWYIGDCVYVITWRVKRRHSVADPVFCSAPTWVSCPEINYPYFHLVLGLSMSGALPPLPICLYGVQVNFTLLYYCAYWKTGATESESVQTIFLPPRYSIYHKLSERPLLSYVLYVPNVHLSCWHARRSYSKQL